MRSVINYDIDADETLDLIKEILDDCQVKYKIENGEDCIYIDYECENPQDE